MFSSGRTDCFRKVDKVEERVRSSATVSSRERGVLVEMLKLDESEENERERLSGVSVRGILSGGKRGLDERALAT